MAKRVKDRVLLLLAIKSPKKIVDFQHIYEKVYRDCGASREDVLNALRELIAEGLARKIGEGYAVTEEGRKAAWRLAYDSEMNLSYRLVFLARFYYPRIADAILPFLRDRPVTVVKVFSDESDPINKVKPIFSRYAKQKPKRYNYINNEADLMRYVDMHAIDFIPYVHRVGNGYPDWLVIDIDAGDEIKAAGEAGFSLIKEVTKEVYDVMVEEFGLQPCVKFSGSRGFQIWVSFEKPIGSFEEYRKAVSVIRDAVEKRLEGKYEELREKYGSLIDPPITTSTVVKRDERSKKILLDWSSMKREGDVRAPFSMHYKTGLVSTPVDPKSLLKFNPEDARVEKVAEKKGVLKKLFELKPSRVEKIVKLITPSLLSFFA